MGRRENGARRRPGQTGRVQGGHCHRATVRHARAPTTGPAVPPGNPVSPDDDQQQRQHNDDFQRRQIEQEQNVRKTSLRVAREHCVKLCFCSFRSLPDTYCCFGLSIDLLEKMSKDLEFDFHLYLVADGTFGTRKLQWNGVVGDLVSGSAHMAFCPLSVTSARSCP